MSTVFLPWTVPIACPECESPIQILIPPMDAVKCLLAVAKAAYQHDTIELYRALNALDLKHPDWIGWAE